MKLIDLKPHWIGLGEPCWGIIIGITFLSPTTQLQRLGVLFQNLIDPNGWINKLGNPIFFADQNRWLRSGETFETMSLTPSVDFSKYKEWHGFIANGEIK